ncbi:hypothetical protein Mapa_012095 [Marchantia paleacea]|nr:hypothetical protein Mapa_012095 [Marchantia paleacea]
MRAIRNQVTAFSIRKSSCGENLVARTVASDPFSHLMIKIVHSVTMIHAAQLLACDNDRGLISGSGRQVDEECHIC